MQSQSYVAYRKKGGGGVIAILRVMVENEVEEGIGMKKFVYPSPSISDYNNYNRWQWKGTDKEIFILEKENNRNTSETIYSTVSTCIR